MDGSPLWRPSNISHHQPAVPRPISTVYWNGHERLYLRLHEKKHGWKALEKFKGQILHGFRFRFSHQSSERKDFGATMAVILARNGVQNSQQREQSETCEQRLRPCNPNNIQKTPNHQHALIAVMYRSSSRGFPQPSILVGSYQVLFS